MRKITGLIIAAPVLAGLLVAAPGCSNNNGSNSLTGIACDASLQAKVDALQSSVTVMENLAASFRSDVGAACKAIAEAGGQTVTLSAQPTDDEVKTACDAAQAAITAKLKASAAGAVTVNVKGGECTVNAQAQFDCEGKCQVDASCKEPDITVRCQGGTVTVKCAGTCSGTVECEGSATAAAQCDGTCNAECTGTCSGKCVGTCSGTCSAQGSDGSCNGTCSGTCTGNCDAQCTGTCTGSCDYVANATVTCNAEARCQGTCTGTATAPECSGTLSPPICQGNADCQANCSSSASLQATCSPPSVQISFTGTVDAAFVSALEANLPILLKVVNKGKVAVDAAVKIGDDLNGILNASATCVAALGPQIQAALQASISIKASVSVSASASGSATTP